MQLLFTPDLEPMFRQAVYLEETFLFLWENDPNLSGPPSSELSAAARELKARLAFASQVFLVLEVHMIVLCYIFDMFSYLLSLSRKSRHEGVLSLSDQSIVDPSCPDFPSWNPTTTIKLDYAVCRALHVLF